MDDYIATQSDALPVTPMPTLPSFPEYVPDETYMPEGVIFDLPENDDTKLVDFNRRYLDMQWQFEFLQNADSNTSIQSYEWMQTYSLVSIQFTLLAFLGVYIFCKLCGFFRGLFV